MATDWNAQLREAAKKGNVQLLEEALHNGADVNAAEPHCSYTALIYASINHNTEIVKRLIVEGAKIDLQDKQGGTPLVYASMHGPTELAAALIAAGADMNLRTKAGETALQMANGIVFPEIVTLLENAAIGIRPSREEAGLLPPPPTKEQANADRRWQEAEGIRKKLQAGLTDPSEVGF